MMDNQFFKEMMKSVEFFYIFLTKTMKKGASKPTINANYIRK